MKKGVETKTQPEQGKYWTDTYQMAEKRVYVYYIVARNVNGQLVQHYIHVKVMICHVAVTVIC